MNKELATRLVRIYPSTYRKLKIGAAQNGFTLAAYIRFLAAKQS